jgi:hypothetical protein
MFLFQAETENKYSAYGTKLDTVISVSFPLICFIGNVLLEMFYHLKSYSFYATQAEINYFQLIIQTFLISTW